MRKKKFGSLTILILAAFLPALGQNEENSLALSLEECIQKTMKNNLGLAVEILSPRIADATLSMAAEKFMPTMAFGLSKQDSNSASYSFLDASETVSTLQNDYSAQVSQLIPTGGSLAVSLTSYMTDTNRRATTINPRYGSTLRLTFSQPLLRDFGFKMSRREIIAAQYGRDISELNLGSALEETIYRAKSTYWSLVYSLENLKVRRQSLKLAEELLEKNKAEIEAGTLPRIEILTAEADVATRRADILEAEAMVKNSEDLLRTIMNLGAEVPNAERVRIIPTDSPSVIQKEISLEGALAVAMNKRPDLQATRVELKNMDLDLSFARNQLFPDLRLQASYWSPGIAGDQILYEGGNALTGQVVGRIPGKSTDAFRDTFDFKYQNWSLGLSLSFSLSNLLSRAYHARAKLNYEQAELRLRAQEEAVFLEIRTAVRAVQTNYQRIEAYRAARELAQKKLEAEEEKFKVGLSTNYFILQYQRDLADAQIMELKAIVDYNISLAVLNRVQGTGLETENLGLGDYLKEQSGRR
jgi:outer membrane protein TolC